MNSVNPAAGTRPEVWGKVPSRNKNFTGRTELLEALRTSIVGQATAVLPADPPDPAGGVGALRGMGGVGKTQMAVEYAHRNQHEYDLVWWVPADQAMLARSSLAALAPYLNLPPASAAGAEDTANAVVDALRRGKPFSRWLLIFDNADEPEDIKGLLPDGPGHVLITSRNHRWEGTVVTVSVDVFTRAESVEFLARRTGKSISEPDADRLAAELGDLPLALEQAGALKAETGISVEEYLDLLHEHASQLLAQGRPSEYPMSMTAAWSISVSSLAARMPEAVELLRYCAFFGPEPIPRDVFSKSSTEIEIGAQLWELIDRRILMNSAIGELARFALLKVDPKTRTLQVHRLIQALVREELSVEDQERILNEVHQLLVGALPRNPDEAANWPNFATLVAHLEPTKVEDSKVSNVRALALDMIRYMYQAGDWGSASQFVDRFIKRWTEMSGPSDPDVLRAYREQGNILREQGKYQEAYELNQQTLVQMRAAELPDADVLPLINSIGADLRARGEFVEALTHDTDSVRLHEEAFKREDPRTQRAVNNLALDYSLNSRFEKSLDLHQETINRADMQSREIGAAFYLGAQNALARVARLNGDYGQACDVGEDAYAYGVDVLGLEHPWTLRTGKDLCIAWRRHGELDRAEETGVDIHARFLRLYGLNHPDTLAAATALSNVRRNLGQLDDALKLISDTVQRYRNILGDHHPYTLACTGNYAVALRVTGSVSQARDLDERTLAEVETRLGRSHHYYLTMATNLASDRAQLGDYQGACDLEARTLPELRRVLGADHPMGLVCAGNMSMDLEQLGHAEEAAELAADTQERLERKLPREHPDIRVFHEKRHLDCDFDLSPI
jgi:tetratricopeptide (TPR) repeat protein